MAVEQRIIELEKKVAFHDAEIKDLSNALIMQHKELEVLEKRISLLKDKLSRGALVKNIEDELPPPHY